MDDVKFTGGMALSCCGRLFDWKVKRYVKAYVPRVVDAEEKIDTAPLDYEFGTLAYKCCPYCLTMWVHSAKKEDWDSFMAMPREVRAGRAFLSRKATAHSK